MKGRITLNTSTNIIARIKFSTLPGEVIKFGLIGLCATLVHATVGYILASEAQMSAHVANFIGFLSAWSVSFFGHSHLTFRNHQQGKGAFYRFIIHSAVMYTLSLLVAHYVQSEFTLGEEFIPAIAAVSIPMISLVSTKIFVFRKLSL